MPTIQKRKTSKGEIRYRALVRIKGTQSISATFKTKSDAVKWGQERELQVQKTRCFYVSQTDLKTRTLEGLIDKYTEETLPQKKDKEEIRKYHWWKHRLGHLRLTEITPRVIVECRNELLNGITYKGTKRTPATVNRYLAALSHVFTTARKEWQLIDHNPVTQVQKLREPRGRIRFLDDQERIRLLEACAKSRNPFLYVIVVLALSTGMRKGEILSMKWKDVDLDNKRITLFDTKNGEVRAVPLVGTALNLVGQLFNKNQSKDNYVFHLDGNPDQTICIRTAWENAVSKAQIQDFHFHDLRHSAASYLAMSGASLIEIAEVLGHKTIQMTRRYSHLSASHTTSIVNRMNNNIFKE